ncbi:MAG: DUF4259 domain-containing protein [Planctomycetota bacterium]|nr:DUF4259 domain-containing protein [Planctomycetota bacterium]
MGAFGTGSFENDDALDWASELEETRGLKFVRKTLREVLDAGDGLLEAPVAALGIAAAEVVAGLNDAPGDDLPEEVENWIEEQRGRSEVDLSPLALEVIERVQTKCELVDQWKKSPDFEAWSKGLKDLEVRLKGEGDV